MGALAERGEREGAFCCKDCSTFRGLLFACKPGNSIVSVCWWCHTFGPTPALAPREAIDRFPPPPIGRELCFGCWAPNEHATWSDAEAAGWWSGTASGPEGWALLCPDCADDYQRNDVEPEPR